MKITLSYPQSENKPKKNWKSLELRKEKICARPGPRTRVVRALTN